MRRLTKSTDGGIPYIYIYIAAHGWDFCACISYPFPVMKHEVQYIHPVNFTISTERG